MAGPTGSKGLGTPLRPGQLLGAARGARAAGRRRAGSKIVASLGADASVKRNRSPGGSLAESVGDRRAAAPQFGFACLDERLLLLLARACHRVVSPIGKKAHNGSANLSALGEQTVFARC